MARIRTIKPEYWEDEVVGMLSMGARLLFIATWNLADDAGRLRWTPEYLKASVFMYDHGVTSKVVQGFMDELEAQELAVAYIGGKSAQRLAYVVNFPKHQRINRPQASRLPAPPSISVSGSGSDSLRTAVSDSRNDSVNDSVNDSPPEGKGREQEGEQEREVEQEQHTHTAREAEEEPKAEAPPDPLAIWLGDLAPQLSNLPPGFDRRTLFQHYGPPDMRCAWKYPDGSSVGEETRKRLFVLALTGYVAEGHRTLVTNEFAGMLRATIRAEAAPITPPAASVPHHAEPVSEEAKALTRQMQARTGRRVLELDRAAQEESAAQHEAVAWLKAQDEETQARGSLKIQAKFREMGRAVPTKANWMLLKVTFDVVKALRAEQAEFLKATVGAA